MTVVLIKNTEIVIVYINFLNQFGYILGIKFQRTKLIYDKSLFNHFWVIATGLFHNVSLYYKSKSLLFLISEISNSRQKIIEASIRTNSKLSKLISTMISNEKGLDVHKLDIVDLKYFNLSFESYDSSIYIENINEPIRFYPVQRITQNVIKLNNEMLKAVISFTNLKIGSDIRKTIRALEQVDCSFIIASNKQGEFQSFSLDVSASNVKVLNEKLLKINLICDYSTSFYGSFHLVKSKLLEKYYFHYLVGLTTENILTEETFPLVQFLPELLPVQEILS